MRLAKRYVREFAADKKKYLNKVLKNFEEKNMVAMADTTRELLAEVDNIVERCDYGYISSFEAVRLLSK